MSDGDADRALAAVLELDDAIAAWSADTFQSDEMNRARDPPIDDRPPGRRTRSALRDPRQVLGPIVEAALALRTRVRAEGRYDLSDLLRDELAAAGVEVRDTADGVVVGSQSRFVRAPVSAPARGGRTWPARRRCSAAGGAPSPPAGDGAPGPRPSGRAASGGHRSRSCHRPARRRSVRRRRPPAPRGRCRTPTSRR